VTTDPWRAPIESGDFAAVEELWEERLEDPREHSDFFMGAAKALGKAGEARRAAELLGRLDEKVLEEPAIRLDAARLRLTLAPKDAAGREAAQDALRELYSDRPGVDAVLEWAALPKADRPANVIDEARWWLDHDVGRHVYMTGRGVGRVAEVNLALGVVRVDFGEKRPDSFRRSEAGRLLKPLSKGDLLLRLHEDPETEAERAKAEPAEVLGELLSSFDRPLSTAEIRAILTPAVPASKWAGWWSKAKKDPRLHSAKGGREHTWSESHEEAANVLITTFQSARFPEKLRMLRQEVGRSGSRAGELVDSLIEAVRSPRRKLEEAAEAWGLLAELSEKGMKLPDGIDPTGELESILGRPDSGDLVSKIRDRRARARAIVAFKNTHPNDWVDIYQRLFAREQDSRALEYIYGALEEEAPDVARALADQVLTTPRKAPGSFLWLLERAKTAPFLKGRLSPVLLGRVAQAMGTPEFHGLRPQAKRLLEPEGILDLCLESADLEDAQNALRILESTPDLEDYRKEEIRSHFELTFRGLSAESSDEVELIYVSARALARRRSEYERLVEVDIPDNAREIKKAREYGDLRENFEYQEAKRQQELLSVKMREMKAELHRARAIRPPEGPLDTARVGARVTLAGDDGAVRTVTLLGPWDSDPDHGVYSYLAPAASALIGARPGDRVEFEGLAVTVRAIEPWSDAAPADGGEAAISSPERPSGEQGGTVPGESGA
jgi:transcription elongation GreA/GreB family factor